jgi:sodium transport system permease protein
VNRIRGMLIVFWKEVRENLRDRRTVFAALIIGPLLGPLVLGTMLQFMVDRGGRDFDRPVSVEVVGAERAPNLVQHIRSRGITVVAAQWTDVQAQQRIRDRAARMVLSIAPDYAARLAAGAPAPVLLFVDVSNTDNQRYVARLRGTLDEYGRRLAAQRLIVRGVDPLLLAPLAVQEFDVSTPTTRSVLALGMLSFFMLLALFSGGMYLAIDSTAGERERGTLEPLLTLPVKRSTLIYGKILATCAFMLLSLSLTTGAFFLRLRFVGLEQLGMSGRLDFATAAAVVAVCLPLIPAAAALLTIIASFTRSYREAQAWLSFVMLLPTLPLAFVSVLNLVPSTALMAVPSLGQHFLIQALLRAETPPPLFLVTSVAASLALGLLLVAVAGRLYRRESLLG